MGRLQNARIIKKGIWNIWERNQIPWKYESKDTSMENLEAFWLKSKKKCLVIWWESNLLRALTFSAFVEETKAENFKMEDINLTNVLLLLNADDKDAARLHWSSAFSKGEGTNFQLEGYH